MAAVQRLSARRCTFEHNEARHWHLESPRIGLQCERMASMGLLDSRSQFIRNWLLILLFPFEYLSQWSGTIECGALPKEHRQVLHCW